MTEIVVRWRDVPESVRISWSRDRNLARNVLYAVLPFLVLATRIRVARDGGSPFGDRWFWQPANPPQAHLN